MSDENIIELYWKRSEAAIQETERAYGRYVHAVAHGILRDEGDAEEIVNDTYLKAWNTIPPERPGYLKGFLARMTRQLAVNRLERNTAAKRGGGQYPLVLEELADCIPDRSAEEYCEMTALRDALNGFLRALAPESRKVFLRRYWHIQTVAEIAGALSMSESKVKSMLMRTRNKLKKYLTEEGFAV